MPVGHLGCGDLFSFCEIKLKICIFARLTDTQTNSVTDKQIHRQIVVQTNRQKNKVKLNSSGKFEEGLFGLSYNRNTTIY